MATHLGELTTITPVRTRSEAPAVAVRACIAASCRSRRRAEPGESSTDSTWRSPPVKFVALLGRSGSGKSTLLRARSPGSTAT